MGCGCKNGKTTSNSVNKNTKITFGDLLKYGLKFIGFLIVVALLPFINLVIIWFIFKTLVLNKDISVKPMLLMLTDKFKKKKVDEEEEEINEDNIEYEMLDVDVIR